MKKAIKITIPKPCHEDWAKMTPTQKGKHCAVCTKEVVDFTKLSDEAIYKHVSKNTNTCGRFSATQLNREIELNRKKRNSLLPYAASLLLPLSIMNPTYATPETETTKNYISLGIGSRTVTPSERAQITTKGFVFDIQGKPLRNVKIISNETEAITWTAKDGSYKIVTLDHEILTFSLSQWESKSKRTGVSSKVINLQLNPLVCDAAEITGDIVSEEIITVTHTEVVGKINPSEISEELVIEVSEEVTETAQDNLNVKITGNITDDAGLPLPGANIIIKGTSTGTQSDFDGNYTIEAEPNQILTFSYVGFETQEITVSNISNEIDVQLEPGALLGEVIITGYVTTSYQEYYEYQESKTEIEARKQRELYREADKNTQKFKEIQQARKKAARKARRGKN